MADQISGLLSPWLRSQRFKMAMPYIKGSILDVGCGTGLLSSEFPNHMYCGVERDIESLQKAKLNNPEKIFYSDLKDVQSTYDSIVLLAVIEHIPQPFDFFKTLKSYLNPLGRIILTTPHKRSDYIHKLGSSIGLFSKEAHDEHEILFNKSSLEELGLFSNLTMIHYTTFQFGLNQLAVYE